ncbi:hypothetical protein PT277_10125 [Acetobacteraceae bacterium ESL0709]|nr:hypothetical protein [Acetobacteraceae bacterium ESL0697]MDF7679037.1 hypothetical protein [Acetobacteraceae bacterium ESL0709]
MPPVHNKIFPDSIFRKKKQIKQFLKTPFYYFLTISCLFPSCPTVQAATSQTQVQSTSQTEDLLLNGPPQGWNANVIGVGKARQSLPLPPQRKNPDKLSQQSSQITQTEAPLTTNPSRNRILIPIPADMGIAAYQSGGKFVIVIDDAHSMDTSSLRGDGIFAKLSVAALPQVTIITIPLPDTRRLFLSQQSEGWVLGDQPPPGDIYDNRREIIPRLTPDGLLLPMRKPGRIFFINDPASQKKLLVATSTLDDGGILSLRHGAQYDLWPSLEGVIAADYTPEQSLQMRRTYDGVILSSSGKPLPDMDKAIYANDVDLKWLGLRYLSAQDAENRYHEALITAADSSPQNRFQKRLEAAQAAFNVGDFLTARSILTVALDDDPEEAFRPDIRFFIGANALLNSDLNVANLLDTQWPDDDLRATQLWKGLYYTVMGTKNEEAAHLLSNDFRRILSYPDLLRPLILPMASEQIARYGTLEDMKALDLLPDAPYSTLARTLRDLRIGKIEQAEKNLDILANDPDISIAEKANEAKISLDFRKGKLKPEEAIEEFGSLLPDARLVRREALVLMLQADAAIRAKQWEKALSALDEGNSLSFQKYNQHYIPMLNHVLKKIVTESNDISPSDRGGSNILLHNTAILHAHLPELPPGPEKAQLLVIYGKLLTKLGLVEEAAQAYSTALPMIEDASNKAEVTNLLATSYMQKGDFNNATHLLTNPDNNILPKEIMAKRNRLIAQIAIASGKPEVGLYLLNGDDDLSAADMRAKVHEDRNEWSLAVPDVRKMVDSIIPDKGDLTPKQQLLALRLASDASRAKDAETLNWLVKKIDNRSFNRDTDHIFKLLVSSQ